MNYEQKYKSLAGRIKRAYMNALTDSTKAVLEEILPELKESEDEKIRKWLIARVNERCFPACSSYIDKEIGEKALAWLEKQKPITIDINAMVDKFSHTEVKGYGIPSLIERDAYQKGIEDTLNIGLKLDKPIKWSEEDEKMLCHCIGAVHAADYYDSDDKNEMESWLKSLKERIGG